MRFKKFTIVLLALKLCAGTLWSQECGFDVTLSSSGRDQKDEHLELERFTADFLSSRLRDHQLRSDLTSVSTEQEAYIVPVVFHIFHEGGEERISKEQVENAMVQVNKEFNGEYGSFQTIDEDFADRAAITNIRFVLAKIDPDGNPTSGITYHNDPICVKSNGEGRQHLSRYSWDNKKYMEVYVMREVDCDGLYDSGVAWYPSTTDANQGIAMVAYNHRYLGSTGTSIGNAPGSISSTLTHEFGHWLNLSHTFSGECEGDGDFVDDTPAIGEASHCSTALICEVKPNYENYMDYSSGCYKMFTQGQKDRMIATLNSTIGYRSIIVSSANHELTGVIQTAPKANFKTNITTICTGDQVKFSDFSTGNPHTFQWVFEGGSPANSSDPNPEVTYANPGIYSVSLTVTSDLGESSVSKELISVASGLSLPYEEQFESSFPPEGWQITSSNADFPWEHTKGTGAAGSSAAVMTDNGHDVTGEVKELITPFFEVTQKYFTVSFFAAQAGINGNDHDELKVSYRNDCEEEWNEIQTFTGSTLSTASIESDKAKSWIPTHRQHWQEQNIWIEMPQGLNGRIQVKFTSVSNAENRVFLDHMSMDQSNVLSAENMGYHEPLYYPNPVGNYLRIQTTFERPQDFLLFDQVGKRYDVEQIQNSNEIQLNCSGLPSGFYLILDRTSGKSFKIIKQ